MEPTCIIIIDFKLYHKYSKTGRERKFSNTQQVVPYIKFSFPISIGILQFHSVMQYFNLTLCQEGIGNTVHIYIQVFMRVLNTGKQYTMLSFTLKIYWALTVFDQFQKNSSLRRRITYQQRHIHVFEVKKKKLCCAQ